MENKHYRASISCLGVCFYIIGFCFQMQQDIPLALLAVAALMSSSAGNVRWKQPIIIAVGLFIVVSLLSIVTSDDIVRSWRMSLMFLPALLIFILLAQYFDKPDLHNLCWILTFVVLGFSIALLWIILCNPEQVPSVWVKSLGSPVLLVPNDIIFIALLMPFSVVLLLQKTKPVPAATALIGLSIFLGFLTIFLLQSRVALIAELVAIIVMAVALKPKYTVLLGGGIISFLLLIDGLMGFPLIAKHGFVVDTRFSLWLAAWRMFLDAPFLGHGPHTFVLFYQAYLQTIPTWLQPIDHRLTPWPHNLYLELLSEQGIVGLVAFIALLVTLFFTLWHRLKIRSDNVGIYASCTLASLISYCISAAFELTFLRQWVVVMLFLLSGIISSLSSYGNNHNEFKN
jgi:O-antigen ligase